MPTDDIDNGIGADGVVALAQSLMGHGGLSVVSLDHDIPWSCSVASTSLDLSRFGLSATDCVFLAEALNSNKRLVELRLKLSEFSAKGALALMSSLKHCTLLSTLWIQSKSFL